MSRRSPQRRLTDPVLGQRDIGIGDVAFGLLLSGIAVAGTSGLDKSANPNQSVGAALAVLVMTVPVVFARRWPLLAAASLAAGAALNWLAIGPMVRCGVTLPAVFFVAFAVGSRCHGPSRTVAAAAFLAVSLLCQSYSDPQLGGPAVLELMLPIALGFGVLGRLLRARDAILVRLRTRTSELREQREQNARLAVAADQERIAADLDGFLHDRVGRMAAVADTGRAALDARPLDIGHPGARDAFVTIQETGRETLTHMRDLVAGLRDDSPRQPQPVLAQLDRLLGQVTEAETRLQVTGDPRVLPPGLELSGYRIVENLLVALENGPSASIEVTVAFGSDSLELTVSGRSARHGDPRHALAAATERAALHGGRVRTQAGGGRLATVVSLPLVPGRV